MRALVLGLVVAVGCSDGNPRLEPRLDLPPASSGAYPFDGLDELELSVAEAGHEQSLIEKTVAIGESLSLDEVPFGNDLVVHLSGLRGNDVEVSYGRTCVFDATADEILEPNPRLYFSRIVAWGSVASAPADPARTRGHGFTMGSDGAVFVGGGLEVTSVVRFDPLSTGSFAELAGVTASHMDSAFAEIADNRGLIIGGVDGNGDGVPLIEVIDARPDLPAELQVSSQLGPRLRSHAAASLVDGGVVIIGGETQSSEGAPFEVTGGAWEVTLGSGDVLEVDALIAAQLGVPRRDHSLTRLGNELGADILVVGGRDAGDAPVAGAELYRPLSRSFETVDMALLNTPRWSHSAVRMPGGFVLVVGGFADNPGGDPLPVAELELYDPVQGRFTDKGLLPDGAGLTEQSLTGLPDGRVLIAGGRDVNGEMVTTVLIARLDPIDGTVVVSTTDSLAIPRAGHSAVSLCDGTILVVGGNADPGEHGAERYNPPAKDRR